MSSNGIVDSNGVRTSRSVPFGKATRGSWYLGSGISEISFKSNFWRFLRYKLRVKPIS